jgi:hypothetical protein
MMLVYNLPAAEALFSDGLHTRVVGLNGSAYVVGGFGFTAAMRCVQRAAASRVTA